MPFSLSLAAVDTAALNVPLLAVVLGADATLDPVLVTPLDEAFEGALSSAISSRQFRGGRDEVMHFTADGGRRRVLLVGTGKPPHLPSAMRRASALSVRQARKLGVDSLSLYPPEATEPDAIEAAAAGLHLGAWEYTDLKTQPPESERRAPIATATLLVTTLLDEAVVRAFEFGDALGEGTHVARRLGMMPGNLCTPDHLERTAREISERHGFAVTVLGRADMEREAMGSFLSVAKGTPQEPKLVAMEHKGGMAGDKPVVLVGKGLCFDSGGISIKPAQGMEFMKFDMSGAGGVLGAMEAIGRLKLPINVVGVFGATTNMPSGTASNPGDVVIARSGKSIEIINTDAEGRLVLADVLDWVKRFEPAAVVDAATLTGAIVIGLGHTATGVFGNDDALVRQVLDAARAAGEPGWEMPMWPDYKELIVSDVADLKNSGGRAAGSITAALFLKEFAEGYPWVHLDIAGTAYSEGDLGMIAKGPTGIPVGTFLHFVRSRVA